MSRPACQLFIRQDCHLCEDMMQQLAELHREFSADQRAYQIEVLDVDSDPAWQRKYGLRVPVLICNEQIICEFFLDPASYREFFNGQQGGV